MATSMIDRAGERALLEELIADARRGMSGAVVLRGEAGIGKTVLIDFVVEAAADLRVLRTVGVEAEAHAPFAALHRMLTPLMTGVARLPEPQRDALEVAWGIVEGAPAEHFLVSLATLSLLAEAAAQGPLLVCVDDAQWLDQESLGILSFVGRRVYAEGIVLVFAARRGSGDFTALEGIPVVDVEGLDRSNALELLRSVVGEAIDPSVADRVIAATGGHPLALRDLGTQLSSDQLIDRGLVVEPLPLGRELEGHYLGQIRELPDETQSWLLLAAAEPVGDLAYITGAARILEIDRDAAGPAERAGIVRVRADVHFRHPLIRSAIYGGATSDARRRAHRALAEATTRSADVDRRIWHQAATCADPDEDIAGDLERVAIRARSKGGYASSADALIRAAELTADEHVRTRRMFDAADAALTAGAPFRARSLIERIDDDGGVDDGDRSRKLQLATDIDIQTGSPDSFGRAPSACLVAARIVVEADPALAEEALLRACHYVVNAEYLIKGTDARAVAATIAAVPLTGPPSTTALVLHGFAALATDGYEAAVPDLRRAVAALLTSEPTEDRQLHRDLLGVTYCMATWDDVSQVKLVELMAERARLVGALRDLDTILFCQSMMETNLGALEAADRSLIEGHLMRSALGATADQWEIYRHPELLAWRGLDAHLPDAFQATIDASETLGIGATASIARIAQVIHELARGNYATARDIARALIEGDTIGVHSRILPDLIEAAVRSGDRELAQDAMRTLSSRATAAATPWALGLLARSRAVLAPATDADGIYRDAIDRLAATAARTDLARAHLLYGEWLRRRKQKTEARGQLRTAHTMFSEIGASPFAERARLELVATGERARQRTVDRASDLTPQENQVARLAAAGDTNAEIAQKLFISSRTVDYHLRKVYRKLDVGSRRQLRGMFD